MAPAARPVVIGHRGASGYRPEHTLAAYQVAIQLGADYIEPDLVSTRDGVLVARHENEMSATTDVAGRAEFAHRHTTKLRDGRSVTGWFTEDFTLAELKRLRTKERLPQVRQHNTVYDGRYEVPTFGEILDLARRESQRLGRTIGVYPETKHPTYFDRIGLSLEEPLVDALRQAGLDRRTAPVFIQSFETANLKELSRQTHVRLVQLVDVFGCPDDFTATGNGRTYAHLVTPAGLAEIAEYADGVGAHKSLVIARDPTGRLTDPSTLVTDAHAAGLVVHAWTFRNENAFLPAQHRRGAEAAQHGDASGEYVRFLDTGLDGVFSDNPDTAVAAREEFLAGRSCSASCSAA